MDEIPRPLSQRPINFEQLVRCLEKRYGAVQLVPDEGLTKLRVEGVLISFLDAERLCLGETTLDQLRKT